MKKESKKSEEKEISVEKEQEELKEEIKNEEEIQEEMLQEENIVNEVENKEVEQEEQEKQEDKKEEVVEEKVEIQNEETAEKTVEKLEEHKEEKKEKKSKKIVFIIIISVMVVALLFLSTIFAITNMSNNNIVSGVYIEDVEVSNLSQEEVTELVNEKISNIETVDVYYGEYNEAVKLEDIGIEVNAKEAIKEAISVGRSDNILIDNFEIIKAKLLKTEFELAISIDEEKFEKMVKNIQAELPGAIKQYSYEIKDDELIIKNGKAGESVNKNELKQAIIENIKSQFNGINTAINIPTKYAEPEKIDIEKIQSEIYKEAKDAYIVDKPFELHKEENGIDLAITIEEAKKILSEEKEKYTIPLKITKPKIAVKDLGDKLFKETLAKYTTIYDAGDTNRGINIGLAAKAINGTILLPGEKFSYNGTVGDTTKEKGYKTGGAYVGGKVVQAYGGGICQLSSTLYNAVLYANLGIVERYNHSYAVAYVPAGRDATVSYGGKDFKFENTRSYPIKIVASAKNGVVSVSIKGIKEEKEYDIELTSTVLSTKACTTVYEKNSSLEEGKEKVIQKGYNGKTSIAYKIVKYKGKTISKTVLSKDTYKPMNRIVEVGTKKVATSSTTTTTNTTTQTNTKPVQTPPTAASNNTVQNTTVTNTTNVNNTTI